MDAELIARISPEHRDRLAWFEEHQGDVLPAPGGRRMGRPLVSPAKGIFKPADLPYALSIKIMLNSSYKDGVPVPTPGGGWVLEYHEENPRPGRVTTSANDGMMQCIADRVPVGIIREQPPPRHHTRYNVLGLALPVRWSDRYFYFESLNPKAVPVADPVSMHAAAAGNDEPLDLDSSRPAVGEKRAQRREQVRRRVEDVLGKALREAGSDYVLPDGRLVAIYYSKVHDGGDTWLGVQNRTKDDDILVLLLGDETDPEHLVFPRAADLLRYKESFSSVGGDRLAPPIHFTDGSFALRRPSKGLAIPLDDRVDAYHELLYHLDEARGPGGSDR